MDVKRTNTQAGRRGSPVRSAHSRIRLQKRNLASSQTTRASSAFVRRDVTPTKDNLEEEDDGMAEDSVFLQQSSMLGSLSQHPPSTASSTSGLNEIVAPDGSPLRDEYPQKNAEQRKYYMHFGMIHTGSVLSKSQSRPTLRKKYKDRPTIFDSIQEEYRRSHVSECYQASNNTWHVEQTSEQMLTDDSEQLFSGSKYDSKEAQLSQEPLQHSLTTYSIAEDRRQIRSRHAVPGYSISQIPRFNYQAEEKKVNEKPGPDAYSVQASFQKPSSSRPSSGFARPAQYNHYRGYVGEYWDSEPGPGAYIGAEGSKCSGPDPLRPSNLEKQRVQALGNCSRAGGCRSISSIFGQSAKTHNDRGKSSSTKRELLKHLQKTGRPHSTGRARPHTLHENSRNTSLVCREDFETSEVIRKPSFKRYQIGEQGSSSFKSMERPELFKPTEGVPATGTYHKPLGWERGTAVLTAKISRPRTVSAVPKSRGERDTGSKSSGFKTAGISEESWVFRSHTQRSPTHNLEDHNIIPTESSEAAELGQQSSWQDTQEDFPGSPISNSKDFTHCDSALSTGLVEIPSFSIVAEDVQGHLEQNPQSNINVSRVLVGTPNTAQRPRTGSTTFSSRFPSTRAKSPLLPLRKRAMSSENSRRLPRVSKIPASVPTYFRNVSASRNPKKRWI